MRWSIGHLIVMRYWLMLSSHYRKKLEVQVKFSRLMKANLGKESTTEGTMLKDSGYLEAMKEIQERYLWLLWINGK